MQTIPSELERLTEDDYVRPFKTKTDELTKEQILDKLEDYVEVKDLYRVPTGSHMRYLTTVDGKQKFRFGGFLFKSDGLPDYVVLRNATKSWTVQTKDTRFFRRMTVKEIKKDYEQDIEELETENMQLREENNKLMKRIKELEAYFKYK